jgi:hypothetical protein
MGIFGRIAQLQELASVHRGDIGKPVLAQVFCAGRPSGTLHPKWITSAVSFL